MKLLNRLLWKTLQLVVLTLLFVQLMTTVAWARETESSQPAQPNNVEQTVSQPQTDEAKSPAEFRPETEKKPLATPSTRRPPASDPYDYDAIDRFNADLFGEGVGN